MIIVKNKFLSRPRNIFLGLVAVFFVLIGYGFIQQDNSIEATKNHSVERSKSEYSPEVKMQITLEVAKSMAEVTTLNIDEYLESLVKRATEAGFASAIDVESGIQIAVLHHADPQQINAFVQRMKAINGINTEKTFLDSYHIEIQLTDLLRNIWITKPESENFQLQLDQYMRLAQGLPDDKRLDAFALLNDTLPNITNTLNSGSSSRYSSTPLGESIHSIPSNFNPPINPEETKRQLQSLELQIVATTEGVERGSLTKQYVELAQGLPSSERALALSKLGQTPK